MKLSQENKQSHNDIIKNVACYDCIKDLTIETKPQIAVIHLGGKSKEKAKFPVKDFLLSHSYLVKYNEQQASGKKLTKAEHEQSARIYDKRDRAFNLIQKALISYYGTATNGDYRTDGMPEIEQGIKGWIERKVWKLLRSIGEPDTLWYKADPDNENFWEEAK